MRNAHFVLMSCSVLLLGAASEAADWPQWRGPNRDGKSPDAGLLKKWPDGGPRRLWHATGIGSGYSSVAVTGGMVYTSGKVGDNLVIIALDMNGKPKWKVVHGPAWDKGYPGSRGIPTIEGGNLYIFSGRGLLGCYDAKTGRKKWTVDITRTFGGRPPRWGYSESVLIHKNLAVVTPGRSNCIVAVNKLTGQTVWTSKGLSDRVAYSSCVVFTCQNVPMIVNMTAKAMVCVSAINGQFLWRNDRAAGGTAVCPTPVCSDGVIFGASGYGNGGACVKPSISGRGVTASQVWETKEMNCHHGGFIVHEGYIYGNHGGGWNCLDLKTGRRMWGERGVGKGSICYADGMLYTFSEGGGRVGLVAAKSDGFSLQGQFSVQGRGKSWAHPVVVGGRLYLRYDDNLYAYDVRDPSYKPPVVKKPGPVATSRPKPKPRPKRRPVRPATPEEKARQIWSHAKNFLANDMTGMAKAKLKELVEKYPDTDYATMAKQKLREIE